MTPRMLDRITDGPQFEDDAIPGLDDLECEDDAYERQIQQSIDDGDSLHNTIKEIARSAAMECPACQEIALSELPAPEAGSTLAIALGHVEGGRVIKQYKCSECGIETAFTGATA